MIDERIAGFQHGPVTGNDISDDLRTHALSQDQHVRGISWKRDLIERLAGSKYRRYSYTYVCRCVVILQDRYGMKPKEVAAALKKSPAWASLKYRLRKELPQPIFVLLEHESMSENLGRTLFMRVPREALDELAAEIEGLDPSIGVAKVKEFARSYGFSAKDGFAHPVREHSELHHYATLMSDQLFAATACIRLFWAELHVSFMDPPEGPGAVNRLIGELNGFRDDIRPLRLHLESVLDPESRSLSERIVQCAWRFGNKTGLSSKEVRPGSYITAAATALETGIANIGHLEAELRRSESYSDKERKSLIKALAAMKTLKAVADAIEPSLREVSRTAARGH